MPPLSSDFPLASADRCVKCGLCLPHCPTYRQTQHEGDSPRGRIALMQGLATERIPLTPALEHHLDGCLGCRACEPVCPAQVPYGALIDAGRTLLAAQRPARLRAHRWLSPWLTARSLRHLLVVLLWLYQNSGVQALLRGMRVLGRGPLARLDALLPAVSWPRRLSAARGPAQAQLFIGCTGEWADRETLSSLVRVASALGLALEIPRPQTCCGALDQHAGRPDAAVDAAHRNLAAFGPGDEPILCGASGCTATLQEYGALLGETGQAFSSRAQDSSAYLLAHWDDALPLKPLPTRVLLHTPCTLKNVVKRGDAARTLLLKIPGIELLEFTDDRCCGAAGSYLLQQPAMADALLEEKVRQVAEQTPALLITSNIGCALHLAAGLRRQGLRIEVLHPATLLARQLRDGAEPRDAAKADRPARTADGRAGALP